MAVCTVAKQNCPIFQHRALKNKHGLLSIVSFLNCQHLFEINSCTYFFPSLGSPKIKRSLAPETVVGLGQGYELPCVSDGVPTPIVRWYFNGVNVVDRRDLVCFYIQGYFLNINEF